MEQVGLNWTDFEEILYLNIFRKFVEKIQVLLRSNKNKELAPANSCSTFDDQSRNTVYSCATHYCLLLQFASTVNQQDTQYCVQ